MHDDCSQRFLGKGIAIPYRVQVGIVEAGARAAINVDELLELSRESRIARKTGAEIQQFFFSDNTGKTRENQTSLRVNGVLNRHLSIPKCCQAYTQKIPLPVPGS